VSTFTDEIAWLSFFLPRKAVQSLARRLPLAALRDRLPPWVAARLRLGLYPARIVQKPPVECVRRHPAWGDPAALDPARPVAAAVAPRASILVVTYGNLDLTRLCLASVQRAVTTTPYEIIAVDNASPDGTAAWLQEAARLLPMTVVANHDNRGFAAANNQAAALARGDVLVFLNNDTVVTDGWLDRLCAHLDDARIGLVGPLTNSCGNQAELGTQYTDLDAMAGFAASVVEPRAEDLPMLTLFCAAMPRALFQAIGGLDEGYGLGMFEDDDLSEAVRREGRRVVLARDVFVHHYGGAAFSRLSDQKYLRIWWENRRRFEKKWGTTWQKR
jgi:GT2 family glycosyltransferase